METVDQLVSRAMQARREDRLQDARRDLVEAVELGRRTGVRVELARALAGLGQMERDLGHSDEACRLYEEAVAIYRGEGGALRLAHTVRHLGDIYREEGDAERASPCYEEALAIYRGHAETPKLDMANAIRGFALLKSNHGEAQKAKLLWREARDLYAAVRVEAGVAESARWLRQLGE